MKRKTDGEKPKFDAHLGFKLPADTKAALYRICGNKKEELAELLRQLAYAVERYAKHNGDECVPRDLDICQRIMKDARLAAEIDRETD